MKPIKIFVIIILLFAIDTNSFAKSFYNSGRSYYVYKKYDKSKEMFLKAVEHYNNGNAYYFLGEIEKIQGNFTKSKEYLIEATKSKRINKTYLKNAYWNLIVFAEQKMDYSEIVIYSKELWEKTKDRGALKKVESLIDKILWSNNKEAILKFKEAINLKKNKQTDEALKLFKSALLIEANFLAAKFEIGLIEFKRKNYNIASDYIQPIATSIPFYAEPHMILAKIKTYQKNYSSAIESYNKAIKYGFNSSKTKYFLFLKRGTAFLNNQQYEEATSDFKKALKIRKRSILPLNNLAYIYLKQKNYNEALKILHKANKITPNKSLIEFQIGSIYYKQKNKNFIQYFNKIYRNIKKGKLKKNRYFKILPILAKTNFENNKFTETIEIINYIPEQNIKYKDTLMKAKSYYHIKKFDKAIDTFSKLSLKTDSKIILCKSYWQSGRKEEALLLMKEILTYNELDDEIKNKGIVSKILKKIEDEEIKKAKEIKEIEKKNIEKENIRNNKLMQKNEDKKKINETADKEESIQHENIKE